MFEYGYNLFETAVEEIAEHQQATLINLAYAHRVSGANKEDWQKFIKANEAKKPPTPKEKKPPKKTMSKEDHMAVIRRLKGL